MFNDEVIGVCDNILFLGEYNLENVFVFVVVVKMLGVINEEIMYVLEMFKGVEYWI